VLFKVCKPVHHRTIQIDHQPDATIFQFIILTFIYSSTCFGSFPVVELLMMGGKTPETRWAVNKRQDNKLKNCCIWLVIYFNRPCYVAVYCAWPLKWEAGGRSHANPCAICGEQSGTWMCFSSVLVHCHNNSTTAPCSLVHSIIRVAIQSQ